MEPQPEKPVVLDDDAPKPITKEQFKSALHELSERAKSAGLRPAHMMIAAYARQLFGMVDGVLSALEGETPKKTVEVKAAEKPEVKAEAQPVAEPAAPPVVQPVVQAEVKPTEVTNQENRLPSS